MTELSYREAICAALAEEMDRDPSVVLLGEDIAPGGVFNVTPGLLERFGQERVIDTPISEMAFTSAAVGAATQGLRPMIEIMFGDFLGLALDSLANQATKYWFVSNGQASVPIVVRTAVGGGGRFGPFHSQTPTGWLLGLPGLKVAAPSTPEDAKLLTRAAIRDENPVVVFEHKLLYSDRGPVPDDAGGDGAFGGATHRRRGGDVTLVAALAATRWALEAADQLAEAGIDAEVIDLRVLRPLDTETVARSAEQTGRLVVIEEGPPMGGYSAEVVSSVAEQVGPVNVTRVTMPDLPLPFSPPLEDWALPGAERIAAAAKSVVAGTP